MGTLSSASLAGASTHPLAGQGGEAALPCLNRNNSIELGSISPEEANAVGQFAALSTAYKKSATAITWNVEYLSQRFGLERLGFLTLTFRQHILCRKEAQRRFNSLATNVLRKRYESFIRVAERQKSGRIHYHLLVVLPFDIRSGFSFEEAADGIYRSASPALRREWAAWRGTKKEPGIAELYGFGRTELMPVRSTAEGIAKYVGKYIGKHLTARLEEDKGWRLVEYSGDARQTHSRFAFVSEGSAAWRAKVSLFAQIVANNPHPYMEIQRATVSKEDGTYSVAFTPVRKGPITSIDHLTEILGPKWAFHHRDFILSLPVLADLSADLD